MRRFLQGRRPRGRVELTDLRTHERDFWNAQTHAVVQPARRSRGIYEARLECPQPVYVELRITFAGGDEPPLILALDRTGSQSYATRFRTRLECEGMTLVLEPPVAPDVPLSLEVNRLSLPELLFAGFGKLVRNFKSPLPFVRKLRIYLTGAASFSIGSGPTRPRDPDDAYRLTCEVMESPAELRRLDAAPRRHEGPQSVLAVYDTRMRCYEALGELLHLRVDAGAPHELAVLIVEHETEPLPAELRKAAQKQGARIMPCAEGGLPASIVREMEQLPEGSAILFLDRSGQFHAQALPAMLLELARHPECLAVYADSDRLDKDGRRMDPTFKPDWSPEYALAINYIAQPVMFRATSRVIDLVGALDHLTVPAFELLLRIWEGANSASIRHIPKILFHDAFGRDEAAHREHRLREERAVVEEHLERIARPAQIMEPPGSDHGALRHLRYHIAKPRPLVSVIIPSKDNSSLLRKAVHSVLAATYDRSEVVIVDNGSQSLQQRALLADWESHERIRICRDQRPFNFSALINKGRQSATGEILVLLNDDAAALDEDWLRELVSLAGHDDVGCVGALLLYPDGTVQHAGIILGIGGIAGHAFRRAQPDLSNSGQLGKWLHARREVSAVTAACLAVRTGTFDALGGFDESFPVALNDVDFCLRARERGLRIVVTPHARLTHFESISRGLDVTPQRMARLARENAKFIDRWGFEILDDPYYSRHLSRRHENLRLRTSDAAYS